MSSTTILSLPAELRQQIVAQTISATIDKKGYHITTPFSSVCKTLQADANEVLSLWLPTASADPLVFVKNPDPETFKHFHAFHQLLNERAARLKNSAWPGVSEITIQVFDQVWNGTNLLKGTHEVWRMSMGAAVYSSQCCDWVTRLEGLPDSVKTVKFDLTLGVKETEAVREAEESMQKIFWYRLLQMVKVIVRPSRSLLSSDRVSTVQYEVVGTFPEWMEDAMGTPSEVELKYYRGEPVSYGEGLFAGFMKNVHKKREAIMLEMKTAAEKKAKKQLALENAREKMRKKMMVKKDFGRRMVELKKRKREVGDVGEQSSHTSNGVKRQKTEDGSVFR
ncbi:hypothetical protein BU16DRAFT_305391 [Lophium mytilinum]|uniref:Uncharacterized protein n=1 Tax=Lophium mytilinum TaxID=390894 RepID=A0A6A6R5P1_9PEZI|nr:hypothetical protein BU16DRAFT_305391 [Lophium mytilinum]